MNSEENVLKTGTTTVGVLGKDLVVLAADKRATAGRFIAGKNVQKVIPITDNIAVTTAGTVSDLQIIVRLLRAELSIKDTRTGRISNVKEAANLLSGMTYGVIRRYSTIVGVCHFLLGGHDTKGPHLYEIYPDGSITDIAQDSGFVSSGSGSELAYGVLEDQWKKDLNEKEAIDLALRAINSALQRDSASGQGVDIYIIDSKGVRKAAEKVLNTKLN